MLGARAIAILCSAAVAACSGAEDPPVSELETTSAEVDASDMRALTEVSDEPGVQDPAAYKTPAPDPVVPVPDLQTGMTAVGSLRPVNDSGVSGNLTVSDVRGGTLVSVSVTGAPPGVRVLEPALHRGTCGETGERVAVLSGLRLTATGLGAVTDTLDVPPRTVMDGAHVLVLKGVPAGPATPPLACAELPLNRPDPPV
ncbi:MAG: hypothetical protein AB1941_21690 [Gemmatimonadota bacterium]